MSLSKKQKPINSLDEVVKNLQRVAWGKSMAEDTSKDLDEHVAKLLTEEAKQGQKRYEEIGVRAFLDVSTGR